MMPLRVLVAAADGLARHVAQVQREESEEAPPLSDVVSVRIREDDMMSTNDDIAYGLLYLSDVASNHWEQVSVILHCCNGWLAHPIL